MGRRGGKKGAKQAKAEFNPPAGKRPKVELPAYRGGYLSWRFSQADRDGPFAWTHLSNDQDYRRVMERLHNFETMPDHQIRESKSHPIPIANLSKEARDRLLEIQKDDVDELMSFRISKKERVFCMMLGGTMLVLWWDPEHRVCPSTEF